MALCESYNKLDEFEQAEYIAKVIHAIQHNPYCFKQGQAIIKYATDKGAYDRVKFGRDALIDNNTPET
jgi:hypothetical protein